LALHTAYLLRSGFLRLLRLSLQDRTEPMAHLVVMHVNSVNDGEYLFLKFSFWNPVAGVPHSRVCRAAIVDVLLFGRIARLGT